jgi:hypothetical protein
METPTDEHLNELIDILLALCEHIHSLAEAAEQNYDLGIVQPISWDIDTVKDKLIDLKMRRGSD